MKTIENEPENSYNDDVEVKKEIQQVIDDLTTNDMFEEGALNLKKVASKVGINQILRADFESDGVSGLLRKEGDSWNIYVNASDSPQRRRFTIAHEIGHLLSFKFSSHSKAALDAQNEISDNAYLQRTGEINPVESEANAIAAKLLMPKQEVIGMHKEGKTVEEMAQRFQVSESAMSVRLNSLGFQLFEFEIESNDKSTSTES